MKWINDLPLEHTSSNGTTFKAERCDLKGPVTVSFPSWPLTEEQKREDFLQFGTWHRGCIFNQLNGFSGYDCITFVYSNGATTGRISSREPAISATPKSGTVPEPAPKPVAPVASDKPGIEARMVQVITEHMGLAPSDVVPGATVRDLGMDSLDVIELVMAVEDEFDLAIPDEALEKVSTVQDVINLITTLRGQ
jgi:acyl carrier protein